LSTDPKIVPPVAFQPVLTENRRRLFEVSALDLNLSEPKDQLILGRRVREMTVLSADELIEFLVVDQDVPIQVVHGAFKAAIHSKRGWCLERQRIKQRRAAALSSTDASEMASA
jgi:hypothetical protein